MKSRIFTLATPLAQLSTQLGGAYLLLIASVSYAHAGSPAELVRAEGSITPKTAAWLHQTAALLPPAMKRVFDEPVSVSFLELPGTLSGQGHLLGLSTRGGIVISSGLVAAIDAGPAHSKHLPSSRHHDEHRLAQATLLHELAHQYEQHVSPISKDSRFIHLTGFRQGLLPWRVRKLNADASRAANAYEQKSPAEAFAVNLEFFLLDPEYACRRPALHRYLVQRFEGFDPFPSRGCGPNFTVPVQGDSGPRAAVLDPSRVYAVDYLFASEAESMMSRWGHAMFRIVLCAPDRAKVGPECRDDLSHHVVLSFAANVDGVTTSYWKGLTGKYPSQLFLRALMPVVAEYTQTELRDLVSLPLKLTRSERDTFVLRALELFWSYRGKYRFVGNNCAVESLTLLKASVARRALQEDRLRTPSTLYADLIELGIGDTSALKDRGNAIEKGFIFPSKGPALRDAFDAIQVRLKGPLAKFESLENYLKETSAHERRSILRAALAAHESDIHVLVAHLFTLETTILGAKSTSAMHALYALLEDDRLEPARKRLDEIIRSYSPESAIRSEDSGYGIPLRVELAMAAGLPFKELPPALEQALGKRAASVKASAANLKYFATELIRNDPELAEVFRLLSAPSSAESSPNPHPSPRN